MKKIIGLFILAFLVLIGCTNTESSEVTEEAPACKMKNKIDTTTHPAIVYEIIAEGNNGVAAGLKINENLLAVECENAENRLFVNVGGKRIESSDSVLKVFESTELFITDLINLARTQYGFEELNIASLKYIVSSENAYSLLYEISNGKEEVKSVAYSYSNTEEGEFAVRILCVGGAACAIKFIQPNTFECPDKSCQMEFMENPIRDRK